VTSPRSRRSFAKAVALNSSGKSKPSKRGSRRGQTQKGRLVKDLSLARSDDHHSGANANQGPKKNGPEIIDFGPVL